MRFAFVLFLFFALACNEPVEPYQKISGKWKAADWLVRGKPAGKNLSNVWFQFNVDKTYQSQLGSQNEKGTYKLKGDYLYTRADGQLEILVKVSRPSADTLVLEMNNSGSDETLVLVKE